MKEANVHFYNEANMEMLESVTLSHVPRFGDRVTLDNFRGDVILVDWRIHGGSYFVDVVLKRVKRL